MQVFENIFHCAHRFVFNCAYEDLVGLSLVASVPLLKKPWRRGAKAFAVDFGKMRLVAFLEIAYDVLHGFFQGTVPSLPSLAMSAPVDQANIKPKNMRTIIAMVPRTVFAFMFK